MTQFTPWKIVHLDAAEGAPDAAFDPDAGGVFVVAWKDGVARITGSDPFLVFHLDRPRDVVAVRIEFDTTAARRPETRLELFWARSGSPDAEFDWWKRSVNATVPPTAGRRVLELPVYDRVDLLRLDPEALASEFELRRLTLLLRPPG